MIKLRQEVSYCLRTLTGARQFCAIRSNLSTAAKRGRPLFETLVMLAKGSTLAARTSVIASQRPDQLRGRGPPGPDRG